MSKFTVVLAPRAESDIAEAFHWYQELNAMAADAFRAEVFDAIDHLADTPTNWPADDDGNRRRTQTISVFGVVRGAGKHGDGSRGGASPAATWVLAQLDATSRA